MLVTALVCFGAVFIVLKASSSVLVPKKDYDRFVKISSRYGKLYDMQQFLREKAITDTKNAKQLNALYKALAISTEDPYTVYMTASEAEAWEKKVSPEKSVESSMLDGNIGYIRLTGFAEDTAESFGTERRALENQGAKALIIDLRGNQGGYTEQGIRTADQLLPECTITSIVDAKGKRRYYNSDGSTTKLPYAVLVDRNTASAAEIVAAAVKENHGGAVLGEKTYGKGVIQREKSYDDGSVLHYTAGEFFTPSGGKINGVGIMPDTECVSGDAEKFTAQDPVIAKAKEVLGL